MRAGPLSNDRVIELLNHYFVSVSISNDAHTRGEISEADRLMKNRIIRKSQQDSRGIFTGEDAVYVLDADGNFVRAIRAPDSIRLDMFLPFLEQVVGELGVERSEPVVKPKVQTRMPKTKDSELLLHLTARYVPRGESGWAKLPAEDWIILTEKDASEFVPASSKKIGDRWDIDKNLTKRILTYFYPPTGNTELSKNVIETAELTATLVESVNGTARVRIDGKLKMKHPYFTTGQTESARIQDSKEYYVVLDNIVGYVDCDVSKRQIKSLRVFGDKGTYAGNNFVVALRSHQDRP
jgi:hypothetical protein